MNENEIMATEEVAENVEPTTEETQVQEEQITQPEPKTYTQDEVNEMMGKRIARNTAKIRKEYDREYGELVNVLKAGTGTDNVSEITETFKEYYEGRGIQMPNQPAYSDRDIEVLARAEAEDIINLGYDEVVDEVDRLADIGVANMSPREKAVFATLAEYRRNAERGKELSKIGVTEDVYGSQEFKDFSAKFSPDTSITEIYEIYNKMQPKKEIRTMGSMKNTESTDGAVKEFYTRDEAMKFTKKDFDNNPELFKAVERSMTKW